MPTTKTSWPKGRSGNPRGRRRSGDELAATLRQVVDRHRFAEKLCETLLCRRCAGYASVVVLHRRPSPSRRPNPRPGRD